MKVLDALSSPALARSLVDGGMALGGRLGRRRGLAVEVVAVPAAPTHRDPQRWAAAGLGRPGRGRRPWSTSRRSWATAGPAEHLPEPAAADGHHRAPARRRPAPAGLGGRRRAAGDGRPGEPEPPASPTGRRVGAVPGRRRDAGRPEPGGSGPGGPAAGGSGSPGGSPPPVTTTPVAWRGGGRRAGAAGRGPGQAPDAPRPRPARGAGGDARGETRHGPPLASTIPLDGKGMVIWVRRRRPRRSRSTWAWSISDRSTCWSRRASMPTGPT